MKLYLVEKKKKESAPSTKKVTPPVKNSVQEPPSHSDVNDTDAFLVDIDVQAVLEVLKVTLKDCSRNVNHFFSPSYQNKGKAYCNCCLCLWVFKFALYGCCTDVKLNIAKNRQIVLFPWLPMCQCCDNACNLTIRCIAMFITWHAPLPLLWTMNCSHMTVLPMPIPAQEMTHTGPEVSHSLPPCTTFPTTPDNHSHLVILPLSMTHFLSQPS